MLCVWQTSWWWWWWWWCWLHNVFKPNQFATLPQSLHMWIGKIECLVAESLATSWFSSCGWFDFLSETRQVGFLYAYTRQKSNIAIEKASLENVLSIWIHVVFANVHRLCQFGVSTLYIYYNIYLYIRNQKGTVLPKGCPSIFQWSCLNFSRLIYSVKKSTLKFQCDYD